MIQIVAPVAESRFTALPQRRPWATAGICLILFWFFRTTRPGGDGDLIVRFIESGAWFIKSELLSEAIFQAVYQVIHSLGYEARVTVTVVTCLAGFFTAAGFFYTLRSMGTPHAWFGIGLFAASGIFRFCFGYIEYYPLLLTTAVWWNWSAIEFLRGRTSGFAVGLWFSLGLWMHQGLIFTFPAPAALPFLSGRKSELNGIIAGLFPSLVIVFIRLFPMYSPIFVEGQSHHWNFVPLIHDPESERLYGMFSMGHLRDIIIAAAYRSVPAWPLLLIAVLIRGREWLQRIDAISLFLLIQFGGLLFLSLTWHPNLGMPADWDLFALEALPAILLITHWLPGILTVPWRFYAMAFAIGASGYFTWSTIIKDARLMDRKLCSMQIVGDDGEELRITVDGRYRDKSVPALLPGRHLVKVIIHQRKVSFNYMVILHPGANLTIELPKAGEPFDPIQHGVGWNPAAAAGYQPGHLREKQIVQLKGASNRANNRKQDSSMDSLQNAGDETLELDAP